MKPEQIFRKIKETAQDIKNYPQHLRWNKQAVEGANADPSTFDPELFEAQFPESPTNYKNAAQLLQIHLRELQDLINEVGFKPNIMYITDLHEYYETDGLPRYLFGLMYPVSGVASSSFQTNVQQFAPELEPRDTQLASAIASTLEAYSAAVVTADYQYHSSDSVEYAMVTIFIGARPQVDVDRQLDEFHLPIHFQVLDNLIAELEFAYRQVTFGIKKEWDDDDAAPTEA